MNNHLKKISVIIPVYNTEKYLRQCLDSILVYQGENLEVIVVDDGSTDRSLEILKSYPDPRLIVYHKENEGLYKTWKFGVMHSTGEYIVFVDSDDFISPEMFDEINKILENADYDLIQFGRTQLIDDKKIDVNKNLKEGIYIRENLKQLLDKYVYTTEPENGMFPCERWGKAFRAEPFKNFFKYLIPDITMFEDSCVVIPYMTQITSLYIFPKSLYFYRLQREGSLCNSIVRIEKNFHDCKIALSYFEENKNLFGFSKDVLNGYYYLFYFFVLTGAVNNKKNEIAKRILSDQRFLGILKKKKGIKAFLLRHKMFKTYRVLGKIKKLLKIFLRQNG